jgi:hypothetical protein
MIFSSPIWLIALVPWSALSVWLLQGRRPQALVPFMALWQTQEPVDRPRRKLQVLPLAVLMMLLAALCAILAGAGPFLASRHAANELHATLIVDRGLTMSARPAGMLRYVQAVRQWVDAIPMEQRSGKINLLIVPGEGSIRTSVAKCVGLISTISPTARDTSRLLPEIVGAQLAATSGPVFVASDQPLAPRDRLIQVAPEGAVQDVAIALLAARQNPVAQVMVRVRNQSSLRTADLAVTSGRYSERQTIQLPEIGRTRDYFFNPPALGTVVSAQLFVQDDVSADDQAWLVREGSSPRIEPRTALDPALGRMIEAYQRSRPATDDSPRLAIAGDAAQLPADAPGILVQHTSATPTSGAVQVVAHAITAHVAWEQLPIPLEIVADPPAGWTPVVSIAGRPIVAVRPAGPRQVWVGFDAPNWSRTPDFVVFWTNVFDYAGGGEGHFASHPLSDWSSQWKPSAPTISGPGLWPGLYRRSDGALRAFDAPDILLRASPHTDWRAHLRTVRGSNARIDLSGALLIAATACIVVASMTWRRPIAGSLGPVCGSRRAFCAMAV